MARLAPDDRPDIPSRSTFAHDERSNGPPLPSGSALTVLVPTLAREASVLRTLHALESTDVAGPVEVIIIDNGDPPTLRVPPGVRPGIASVRVLHEPTRGKTAAINRALTREPLGDVVAVLDDDMEPAAGWCAAVIRSAQARPNFDIFTGRSHVVWPEGIARPPWADHPFAVGCEFSSIDLGSDGDVEMGVAGPAFPSGNHFWFRRRVLASVPRFPDSWLLTDAEFVVRARWAGHRGVFVPEVSCGHRIQPHLISPGEFRDRALRLGRGLERVHLAAARAQARGRVRSLASAVRAGLGAVVWTARGWLARFQPERQGVPARAWAAYRYGRYIERTRRAVRDFIAPHTMRDASKT